jgi:hypothetical protein
MEFSQHILVKFMLYSANPDHVSYALADGVEFLDLNRDGSPARVFEFLPERWLFPNP